jgi:hypothetical protein
MFWNLMDKLRTTMQGTDLKKVIIYNSGSVEFVFPFTGRWFIDDSSKTSNKQVRAIQRRNTLRKTNPKIMSGIRRKVENLSLNKHKDTHKTSSRE